MLPAGKRVIRYQPRAAPAAAVVAPSKASRGHAPQPEQQQRRKIKPGKASRTSATAPSLAEGKGKGKGKARRADAADDRSRAMKKGRKNQRSADDAPAAAEAVAPARKRRSSVPSNGNGLDLSELTALAAAHARRQPPAAGASEGGSGSRGGGARRRPRAEAQIDEAEDDATSPPRAKRAKTALAAPPATVHADPHAAQRMLRHLVFGAAPNGDASGVAFTALPVGPTAANGADATVSGGAVATKKEKKRGAAQAQAQRQRGDAGAAVPVSSSGAVEAETGAPSFLETYGRQRIAESASAATADDLLREASEYFRTLNKTERERNRDAAKRVAEMKRANKAGGDKDGFTYVVPSSTKRLMKLDAERAGDAAWVDSDALRSHFLGDGVDETERPVGRRKKRRPQHLDDFYQFQVVQKWTRNAESFLARGRAGRQMFSNKRVQNRTTKGM